MALSEKQLAKLNQHFKGKNIPVQCPLCHSNQLSTGDICISPILKNNNINLGGGPVVPMIQLICNNCGNIMHIAAVPVLGKDLGD